MKKGNVGQIRTSTRLLNVMYRILLIHATLVCTVSPAAECTAEFVSQDKQDVKPYSDIITEAAETQQGVFHTHRIGEKVYFEIPQGRLEDEFLWVSQYARTQTSYSYAGMPIIDRVVRWQQRGNRILLRNVEYARRADPGTAEARAVENSGVEAILYSFEIITINPKTGSPVIDVTDFFTSDPPEFSPQLDMLTYQSKGEIRNVKSVDTGRSYIESVKSFPINVETEVTLTFRRSPLVTWDERSKEKGRSDPSLSSVTVVVHHSMVALPKNPMQARRYDYRIGIFKTSYAYFSSDRQEVEGIPIILRWRLEKQDSKARLSEPVKPIVFYIGREVPKKYTRWIKEGVELWQGAFEKAGFKNAIIARDAPAKEDDANWFAEDARYSVIRWLPSTVRDGFGPTIVDPRTGEILEADVRLHHNVVSLERDYYFTMCSPADMRSRKLPLPDDVIGPLIRNVTAHEVGHSLGLRHNRKSSQHYTVEQLRDPKFTKQYGYKASLMDYTRYNYVAQPGDGAVLVMDRPGIYDEFAIEWAYTPFPGKNSVDEKPLLDRIAARQSGDKRLLWGAGNEDGKEGRADPFARGYDLSNDPIRATEFGMRNVERLIAYLPQTGGYEGEDFSLLEHMYDEAIGHLSNLLKNVAALVGGVEYNKVAYGQDKPVFIPIDPSMQRQALVFLMENAFSLPNWIAPKDMVTRLGYTNVNAKVTGLQKDILDMLFNTDRVERLIVLESAQSNALTVTELIKGLADGIFSEVHQETPTVGPQRRWLQQDLIDRMMAFFADSKAAADLRAAVENTMMDLMDPALRAADHAADAQSRAHFRNIGNRIRRVLVD